MMRPGAVLAIALAVGVAAGCTLVWELGPPSPGFVEHVIFPAGTVLRGPVFGGVRFEVPPAGGVLIGAAEVDHTSLDLGWCPVGNCAIACGIILENSTYGGPAWSYTVDVTFPPGHYYWGPRCDNFGNATFTQPLELVTP
jgi:hypothetical protein